MDTRFERVLLVDDNDIDNFINERMITTSNFSKQVTVKNSAEGALDFLRRNSDSTDTLPQVIFLDLNMPVMDGLDCLASLKQDPILKDIPVIIYSTTITELILAETKKLGVHSTFKKPDSIDSLSEFLRQYLKM